MDPLAVVQLPVYNPFLRAQQKLQEVLASPNGKPLPKLPVHSDFLKNCAWDNFNAILNLEAEPPTLVFMGAFRPPASGVFTTWLAHLVKLNRSFAVLFGEGSLQHFTDEMLEAWRNNPLTVHTIRFQTSLAVERQALCKVLRAVNVQEFKLDLFNCGNFKWEDWRAIAPICHQLTECDLSSCANVTIEIILYFLGSNLTIKNLTLCGLQITSEIFTAISVRHHPLESLNLASTQLTDETLQFAAVGTPKLTSLSLKGCTKITDKGVIPFLKSWNTLANLDLEQVNLTPEGTQAVFEISNLRSLSLAEVKGVNDTVFSEADLRQCALQTLNVCGTGITATGLNALLASVPSLVEVDVTKCRMLSKEELQALKQQYPRVQLIAEVPQMLTIPLYKSKPTLWTYFRSYLESILPFSEVDYDSKKDVWSLRLVPHPQTEALPLGSEMNQLLIALRKAQVKVCLQNTSGMTSQTATQFFTFLELISSVVTELTVRSTTKLLAMPSFLPRLTRLEICGGVLSNEFLQNGKFPALRSLALEGVEFETGALALVPKIFASLENWTLKKRAAPYPWELVQAFTRLPNVVNRSFDLPEERFQNTEGVAEIALVLHLNELEGDDSKKLAAEVAEAIPTQCNVIHLIHGVRHGFEKLTQKMVLAWNKEYGQFLMLTVTGERLTGKIKLPLRTELPLSPTIQDQILKLARGLPLSIEWIIETSSLQPLPIQLPEDLTTLAKELSPSITSFTWKHQTKDEKSPLPVPLCNPFLGAAARLEELSFEHVSFNSVALREAFPHAGLRQLRLDHCHGISSQEIRSWDKWGVTLQTLTLSNCVLNLTKSLETALGDTFPSLVNLNLEGTKAVTNDWIHHLSEGCTTLEELNLKKTSINDGCFTPPLFQFSQLHTLNVAYTEVTDAGLNHLACQERHIKTLDISGCYVCGAGFTHFEWKIPLLENVIWRQCELVLPNGLVTLAKVAPYLRMIDLTGSPMRDMAGLNALSEGCKQLKEILVDNDAIPQEKLSEAPRGNGT